MHITLFPICTKGINPVLYLPPSCLHPLPQGKGPLPHFGELRLQNSPNMFFNYHFFLESKITKEQLLKSEEKQSSGPLGNREKLIFTPFLVWEAVLQRERSQSAQTLESETSMHHVSLQKWRKEWLENYKPAFPGLHAWESPRKKNCRGSKYFLSTDFFKIIYFDFLADQRT